MSSSFDIIEGKRKKKGFVKLGLIDPDKKNDINLIKIIKRIEKNKFDGIFQVLKKTPIKYLYGGLPMSMVGFGAFSGSEVFLRNNLTAGGCGTITAVANVNASAIRAAYDGFQAEDGEALQSAITRRRQIIQTQPMIPALKSIIATITGDENWRRVRPPLEPLSASQTNNLIEALS